MNPPRLTAVIIARDAQRTIRACVEALRFCDQVLVGENQSRDGTIAEAQQAGAQVITVPWEGYAKTKNQLLARVQEGWILSVDADEIVTPELAKEIRAAIGAGQAPTAFAVSRQNYFLGIWIRHCGWSPDWQIRLFRAGSAAFEEKPVHEGLRVSGTVGRLQGWLKHFSYASLQEYLKRMNQYTSLADQARQAKGRRFSLGRLLLDPLWTFKKMYLLKGGWQDGFVGLALCLLSALNTLVKHAKHWELERRNPKTPIARS